MGQDEILRGKSGESGAAEYRNAREHSGGEQAGAPQMNGAETAARLRELQRRFEEQEHELHVHQIELEIQNEELRRASAELARSYDRYADLFEFAPVGYLVFGEHGLIEDINLTGCIQLGASRDQLIGRRLSLFVDETQRTRLADLLRGVFQAQDGEASVYQGAVYQGAVYQGAGQRLELKMRGLDDRSWDAQLECLRQPGAGQAQARAVLTDISDLKGAQREIERLNQTLELRVEQRTHHSQQLSEELRTFVYSVTHDMTRPLRQVQGFADLLTKHLRPGAAPDADTQGEPAQKTLRYLAHLNEAAAQMNLQMAALIAFFQSSQPLNKPRPTDLNRVIGSVRQELRQEMAGREVRLTHDPLPTLWADGQGVQTVFSNLISNAIKFTRPRAEAQIHVGVEERGGDYLFSVRDNGVGFDTRQSERMFGLFQRLHSERSFEGQGMGLALVRRIVNSLHGRVWAESVPDQGSVFWVQLPATGPEAEQLSEGQGPPPSVPLPVAPSPRD
ncbi:sensor histidine kinase [Deinococcus sp.]|uniref:sensor histidine kinase n=1 Tax=Deinococcus sp. TaxID=47478 RepID=UPI003C7D1C6B